MNESLITEFQPRNSHTEHKQQKLVDYPYYTTKILDFYTVKENNRDIICEHYEVPASDESMHDAPVCDFVNSISFHSQIR